MKVPAIYGVFLDAVEITVGYRYLLGMLLAFLGVDCLGRLSFMCHLIHHIHKWPTCNFEKFKMSAAKEKIE